MWNIIDPKDEVAVTPEGIALMYGRSRLGILAIEYLDRFPKRIFTILFLQPRVNVELLDYIDSMRTILLRTSYRSHIQDSKNESKHKLCKAGDFTRRGFVPSRQTKRISYLKHLRPQLKWLEMPLLQVLHLKE